MPYRGNYLLQLQMLISHFDIQTMTQEEINFLQLHFMERLETVQIAQLLETDVENINLLKTKFSIQNLPTIG
jgi:hypothetical protein